MNGSTARDDADASTLRGHPTSRTGSDSDAEEYNSGDYSTRMEEIFQDDNEEDDDNPLHGFDTNEGGNDDIEEEDFVYEGVDTVPQRAYRDQLRDILGSEHSEEDELPLASTSNEVAEKVGLLQPPSVPTIARHIIRTSSDATSDTSPSTPVLSETASPAQPVSPRLHGSPSGSLTGTLGPSPAKATRPSFLHPHISRLRSFTPQTSPSPSGSGASGGADTRLRKGGDGALLSPGMGLSALSGTSSMSHLNDLLAGTVGALTGLPEVEREVFQWTRLRGVEEHVFVQKAAKASAVLGTAQDVGVPTVLAANGLICLGMDSGKVYVFDFKQALKCICHAPNIARPVGAVTAVALSNDHTYIASGHSSGYILLYDLKNPTSPARTVVPTSMSMIASGRQEGHLTGSRIISLGFVANRHTAIISADENGLAFYHSLGKVLFVEAADTLRILGRYPENEMGQPVQGSGDIAQQLSNANGSFNRGSSKRRRLRATANPILGMGPLPLGTVQHPTDAYQVVAILTAAKLVIVGLKPSAKTWYRRHRQTPATDGRKQQQTRWRGCMAWFPSILEPGAVPSKGRNAPLPPASDPVLAYSWAEKIYLLIVGERRVKEKVKNSRTGKESEIEVGVLAFEEGRSWTAGGNVLALQWLNANQIVILVGGAFEVYDIRTGQQIERAGFDLSWLAMPRLDHDLNGAFHYTGAVDDVSHSIRTYKGKVFLLGQGEMRVGSLLTWADRILHLVENGDFLSAIELTRSYYTGEAEGNKNGLPEDPVAMRTVVGTRMRQLMSASVSYAFSEDRLTDATHFTPDGRGVDRTILFEDLATTCARACIALEDYDFLFEDVFQNYDNWGIVRIYLQQLERFILNGTIRHVPPRITQRLIGMHEDDNNPTQAETVIWHIAPDCLDINQSIKLCQRFRLYDALIYVYTRAIQDYVSPLVELLGLIRQVQQYRRARRERATTKHTDESIEPIAMDGYKIFSYLADALSGMTYPSREPMPDEEASKAKKEIYTFLFFGRSSVWPPGSGKLVLTADKEDGPEPTYPYLRLLLRFDAESFLHALDIAFEDAYLNDGHHGISRLVIVNILLEVLATPDLSSAHITLVNIFLARNVPKYPQFIQIAPSALHSILIALVQDPDEDSREDRQLAAEYLLSAYTPHQSEQILELFEQAGFYRILRSWHRHEQQWSSLLLTYVHDPDLRSAEMFSGIEETIDAASRRGKRPLEELVSTVSEALPRLLESNIKATAAMVDSRIPELHEKALETALLGDPSQRYTYLRYLLAPPLPGQGQDDIDDIVLPSSPSHHISKNACLDFITLQCQFEPQGVKATLQHLSHDRISWDEVVNACEVSCVYDAAVWSLNRGHGPDAAIKKLGTLNGKIAMQVIDSFDDEITLHSKLESLDALIKEGISICRTFSHGKARESIDIAENLWFQLMDSQIKNVQAISSAASSTQGGSNIVSPFRTLVHETFSAMMSVTGSDNISLPRMFKRLVDSATGQNAIKGTAYTEFRTILTGVLEYYRTDGEMLLIAKHLVGRDVFASLEQLTQERSRGWSSSMKTCSTCQKPITSSMEPTAGDATKGFTPRMVVTRTGAMYHEACLPSTL